MSAGTYSKKLLQVQFPTIQLLLHYEQQLKLHPATQQDRLEHTATAKLFAILSTVVVLKLIIPRGRSLLPRRWSSATS